MNRIIWLFAVALMLTVTACTSNNNSSNSAGDGTTPQVLRFSGIPDADKEKLTKQYEVVTAYLTNELGVTVEYVHVPDYTAAVTALAANKVDLVWLGGVTSVEAETRTDGEARLLCNRESDLKFKSYFIAQKDLGIGKRGSLKDIPNAKDLTFTFGSKLSTSGHIMPRHFLTEAGMVPEDTFKTVGWQASGGHSATLKAVQTGTTQVGALNYKTYDKAKAAGEADNTEIIFETPAYVDYCMVGHKRLGGLNDKIIEAFTKLSKSDPEQAEVLEAFQGNKFVKANPKDWDGIRAVLKAAYDSGILTR
ncbi:MAG: phosphate/phosphite/phosphonate ABC transporter substrate-binding protein [Planctomycetota bacterium]|jgi:phosphonate transport system substrate-binding protein